MRTASIFPGQLLRAMSFMGLDVAAVARVEPNAGAATGAAEPKPVLWPKRAMAAEADRLPNTGKEEFNKFGKYLPETLKSML